MLVEAAAENQNPCVHGLKGTVWGGVAAISSLAIPLIVAAIALFAAYTVTMDGLILHKWAMMGSMNLLWALPLSTALITLNIAVTLGASEHAARAILKLKELAKDSGRKSLNHFQAFCSS